MNDQIVNLPEDFLFGAYIPEGVVSLDERGLIRAVLDGYEDRVCDLRALAGGLSEFFSPLGAQQTGPNVILAQLTTSQGKVFTRSLDVNSTTPAPSAPANALTAWAAQQMAVDPSVVISAVYGTDPLRLISTDTLGYLADTIGAVLYQSAITDGLPAVYGQYGTVTATRLSQQTLLATYFPRLQYKGTAQSFDSLGRLLGWDDVLYTPLWSRLSPRVPNDPGNPANDQDFSAAPDFYPQAQSSAVYDPTDLTDGPFFAWAGTVSAGTNDTSFYTQVVNGFQPWVTVEVVGTASALGTIAHPASGSYVLQGGAPYTKAWASAGTSPLLFQALADGDSFNGLAVDVFSVANGSLRGISISSQLSSIKFRSSFFDVDLGVDYAKAEQAFGTLVARPNSWLQASPILDMVTGTGTAASPYRPFSGGTVSFAGTSWDYLTPMGGTVTVIAPQTQASVTQYQQDTAALQDAALHGAQALEEVRAATRFARNVGAGYSSKDSAGYAPYDSLSPLFTTSGTQFQYSGVAPNFPSVPYSAQFYAVNPSIQFAGEQSQTNPDVTVYAGLSQQVTGTYFNSTGSYAWNFYPTAPGGTTLYAAWTPTSTEVVRPEPTYADKQTGTVLPQARPEDQQDDTLASEVLDEYPWRRDLTVGGELVDLDFYTPIAAVAWTAPLDASTAVEDQSGVRWNVYAVNSTYPVPRLVQEERDALNYVPAHLAVAYTGNFRNLAAYGPNQTNYFVNPYDPSNLRTVYSQTDYDILFSGTHHLYIAGLVDNVLVADPVTFNSSSHRDNLQGWLTCNEHPDAPLALADNANSLSSQILYGVQPSSRVYDAQRGWVLHLPASGGFDSTSTRYLSNALSVSFWVLPDAAQAASSAVPVLFSYGPLSITLPDSTLTAIIYSQYGTNAQVLGTLALSASAWNQIQVLWTTTSVQFGVGSMSAPATLTTSPLWSNAFAQTDSTLSVRTGARGCSVHDLRLWNMAKLPSDLEAVRSYNPVQTLAQYRLGRIYTANRFDCYGLTVLPNGFCAPAALPPWMEMPKYARVSRYNSYGTYQGESRFEETGVGGGQIPPSTWQMGSQFFSVTAAGTFVVSTQQGAAPGWDAYWANDTSAGTYYRTTGSNSSGSITTMVASGSGASPWPNYMEATNPCRDRIWVQGDTGVVYEVTLQAQAVLGAYPALVANPVVRNRTQSELAVSGALVTLATSGSVYTVSQYGTIYPTQLQVTAGTSMAVDDGQGNLIPNGLVTGGVLVPSTGAITVYTTGVSLVSVLMPASMSVAEQPAGAAVLVALPGTRVSVSAAGSVCQSAYSGTVTTPPAFFYLNSQIAAQVSGAALLAQWVDVNSFGLGLGVPALASAGEITVSNTSGLQPGFYRLTVASGNIGQVDAGFAGFRVQITVGATILQETLLAGYAGANFQGQDVIDFQVKDAIIGDWLLIFDWTNDLADPARGTVRQFALYGYTLEFVAAQVWQMAVNPASSIPMLMQLSQTTPPFGPASAPGGWYTAYDSYGTAALWEHESLAYTGNDTLVSAVPESSQLTGRTAEKREDVIITATGSGTNGYYFTLPDAPVPVFSAFGTGFTIA